MDYIYFGLITGPHGIKGELKVLSDFERLDLVLKENFPLIIDGVTYHLTNYRNHQNKILITLDKFSNINDVLFLCGKEIFINRADLNLNDDYLMQDLIGYKIKEKDKYIGKIDSIYNNKAGYLLKIESEKKYFYIPFHDNFIKKVNTNKKEIEVVNIGGLK